MVSMALAKYQAQARLIWLSDQAAKAWIFDNVAGGTGAGPFPSLGFIPHSDKASGTHGYITDADTKKWLLDIFV